MRGRGAIVAGLLALAPVPAHAAEPVPALVAEIARCTGRTDLAVSVVGPARDDTALSDRESEDLRLRVETALQAAGLKLVAAGDVNRLRALREGTTGLSGGETEALVAGAFAGDAAVFVVAPRRVADGVAHRLQAITPDAACKATSGEIVTALAAPGAAQVDRVMDAAVRSFAANDRAPSVAVCPFVADGGHSACTGVLTDRLVAALGREAASANRALQNSPLEVTRGCAAPEGVVATGRFGLEGGRSWLELEFRRGSTVLATLPRTAVDVAPLACDPRTRPFLDHVAATMARDPVRLDVSAAATPFRPGDRLDVAIRLDAPAHLHCWVLAADGTAYPVWPLGDAPAERPAGTVRYPAGLDLGDIVLSGAFENLFHCFATRDPPPAALDRRWRAAAFAEGVKLLSADDVRSMLDAFRALPGTAEAASRIVVR